MFWKDNILSLHYRQKKYFLQCLFQKYKFVGKLWWGQQLQFMKSKSNKWNWRVKVKTLSFSEWCGFPSLSLSLSSLSLSLSLLSLSLSLFLSFLRHSSLHKTEKKSFVWTQSLFCRVNDFMAERENLKKNYDLATAISWDAMSMDLKSSVH